MKKGLLILAIAFAALSAWMLAFPNKNPLKKLFGNNTGYGAGSASVADQLPGNKTNNAFGVNSQSNSSVFSPVPPPVKDAYGFPITMGDRGAYVSQIQNGLNVHYGSDLDVDGIFGTKTYKALSSHGFNADAVSRTEFLRIINPS